jgi:hypothetical protein
MSRKKLALGALEVETFPTGSVVEPMMRPPVDTEFNEFTCAAVGCTYEAPCG